MFHPAAALYTPASVEILREDFRRLPEMLAMPLPQQPDESAPAPAEAAIEDVGAGAPDIVPAAQLGLF